MTKLIGGAIVLAVLIAVFVLNSSSEGYVEWSKFVEEPLVKGDASSATMVVERKDPPGEIRMFRGTTTIAAPINKVAAALAEPAKRMKWVERIAEDKLVSGAVEEGAWVTYEWYNLVWPVSDRDYIMDNTMKRTTEGGKARVIIHTKSGSHPDYPERSDRVRGNLPQCTYTLDQVSDNETKVEVIVQVDPAGSLPGFLVNVIQNGWTGKTFRALNGYVTGSAQ